MNYPMQTLMELYLGNNQIDEIKEVIMQSAIYCGIPAANATFHLAESVWDELGVESLQD